MHIPSMSSITNLPREELRNPTVAFKILVENLEEMKNPDGDGNSKYYETFKAFKFLGKDLAGKKHYAYQQEYSVARSKNK